MANRKFARALAPACLLLLAGIGLADEPDRIEIYKPLPSTGMVLSSGKQGSGFLVDRADRLLITNHHVASTGQDVQVVFPVYDMGQVLARRDYYYRKAPRIPGKCLLSLSQRDLAILQLKEMPAEVPEVKLANERAKLTERAHLLGNPGKSSNLWIYGTGKVYERGETDMPFLTGLHVRSHIIRIKTEDRTLGPGASGGPVVNDRGELIGVIQSGPPDASFINCIDALEVRAFLGAFHRGLGTQALRSKDYNEAIARCTKALAFNAQDALAFNERGAAYTFQTRYDEAIADYSSALKLDPKLSRTWRSRATCQYFKGNYQQAVADCTEAIRLDRKYAQAYLSRSKAHGKLGNTVAARNDYDMAVQLDPSLR